jgi:hypothetical protein
MPRPEPRGKPASHNPALDALLKASSLYCDFFSAHGAVLVGGRLKMDSVSYQGGPFSYQAIDLQSGTATMSGAQGVTGSIAGKLPVKVTSTDIGLTFTGIKHNGDIVVVTVYAVFDSDGHFPTVMSQHGAAFRFSTAQFYGACSASPTGIP